MLLDSGRGVTGGCGPRRLGGAGRTRGFGHAGLPIGQLLAQACEVGGVRAPVLQSFQHRRGLRQLPERHMTAHRDGQDGQVRRRYREGVPSDAQGGLELGAAQHQASQSDPHGQRIGPQLDRILQCRNTQPRVLGPAGEARLQQVAAQQFGIERERALAAAQRFGDAARQGMAARQAEPGRRGLRVEIGPGRELAGRFGKPAPAQRREAGPPQRLRRHAGIRRQCIEV